MKFEEAIEEYLLYVKAKDKIQSYYKIKSRIDLYIKPFYDLNMNIYRIKNIDYLNYQNKINSMNLSFTYKKTIHYLNVAFFNYCKRFLNLKNNVASDVGFLLKNNCNKKQINVWSNKDFKKFIKNVDLLEYKVLFKLLFYTGCRLGEALALKWIDLDNNKININKTITKESYNGNRIISTPKTISSNRTIEIDFILKYNLIKLKKHYLKNNVLDDNKFIFGYNKPLSPTTITRVKNNYCKISGVKQIKIHEFRHSHATNLLSKNIPITLISERLGHNDIALTLNVYSHVLSKDKKRVIKTLIFNRLF